VSDRFFSRLSDAEKKAVTEGVDKAKKIHRDMTRAQDLEAKDVLTKNGMEVTELTPAQIDAFRKVTQPAVRAWLESEPGNKEWVTKLLAAVETANKARK